MLKITFFDVENNIFDVEITFFDVQRDYFDVKKNFERKKTLANVTLCSNRLNLKKMREIKSQF